MKILVCGGRDYDDRERVNFIMRGLWEEFGQFCLIEGGATGADRLARDFMIANGLPVCTFPANWKYYSRPGGPIRNQWMMEYGQPEIVVAFPGGGGTASMVSLANQWGVEVREIVR